MAEGFLGILMLDTRFPRPPGDIGCARTFERAGIAVRYLRMQGVGPRRAVQESDPAMLESVIQGALELEREGAALVATTCGFLSRYQPRLASALSVPVITSSLLQVRELAQPGIVTIDRQSLGPAELDGAGVPPGVPVQGVRPGSEFRERILGNHPSLDLEQAREDVVQAARTLVDAHPELRSIVLECTNMPPYREAVREATGRLVADMETLLLGSWRNLGSPRRVRAR
jgi:hypothetical protein